MLLTKKNVTKGVGTRNFSESPDLKAFLSPNIESGSRNNSELFGQIGMSIYTQIDTNKRKTLLVMGSFIVLVTLIGYVFGQVLGYGSSWFGVALIFSGLASLFSYYFSDKLVLAISNAKEIYENDNPKLFHSVENLCIGAGLPRPKIYLIEDTAPNAFATGRDPKHSVIVVTTGLLQKLDKLELEGVIAHELSHVGNFDIRLMSIAAILVGTIALLSDWFKRSLWFGHSRDREERNGQGILMLIGIVAAIFAPLIAQLLKLALSRKREFLADASAALLTRYPDGLASALEKIAADREPLEVANSATAHLYIVNPLKDYSGRIANLFNTHPPIEERIAKLRAM